MVKLTICVFFFIILVLNFYSTEISCHEVEGEPEYSYDPESLNGPEKWGDLHLDWEDCKNGTMQSPIDLSDEMVEVGAHLMTLNTNYAATNATIMSRDHDVTLNWLGGGGTLQINDTEYVLGQTHWHSPSEHTFNGERFALELHNVHETAYNKTAVIGIIYRYGEPDAFLTQLTEYLETLNSTNNQEIPVGVLDPNDIEMGSGDGKYYRYIGSLTTPPCTEHVAWTMVQQVRTVSTEQVRLLRAAVNYDANARPLQDLNNRPIYLYEPQDPVDD